MNENRGKLIIWKAYMIPQGEGRTRWTKKTLHTAYCLTHAEAASLFGQFKAANAEGLIPETLNAYWQPDPSELY